MIRLISDDEQERFLRFVNVPTPAACRIACLLQSYGTGYDFARFRVQTDTNGRYVAAIGSYYGDMTVYLTEKSDIQELAELAEIIGFHSLQSDLPLPDSKHTERHILMRLKAPPTLPTLSEGVTFESTPSLQELWTLLKQCEEPGFSIPDYEYFLPDASHKLRHHTARLAALNYEGRLTAAAMTIAESSSTALIGAVCVLPEYRRMRLGSLCIAALCQSLTDKTVLLLREEHKNEAFYRQLGFENIGYSFSALHQDI